MNSDKLAKLLLCISTVLVIEGCTKNINLYSDSNFEPVPRVSLKEYKSVQLRNHKYQNPNLALGVAIAGGGSRAEYFGMGVLIGLEEIKEEANSNRNFLSEVDYFSTVSGGGYAAGYFLTIQKNLLNYEKPFGAFYFSRGEKYKNFVGKSAKPYQVLNNNKNERGSSYSMTKRLDYEVLQYSPNPKNSNKFNTQMKLKDFYVKLTDTTNMPSLPILVPNGTIYNNGERLPFMPHIIGSLKINSSLRPNKADIPLNSDGFSDGYDLPLTYAITASSAFPGVLPITKFGIKDTSSILVVLDGGAVDNLGYTTLFELLNQDQIKNMRNKRALIIDCSGQGELERFSKNEKIRLLSLLNKSLLYTIETKYMQLEDNVKHQSAMYGIPESNSLIIGFSTIRDHLKSLPAEDKERLELSAELKRTKDKDKKWFKFYSSFRKDIIKRFPETDFIMDEHENIILSSLSSTRFKEFTPADVLLLYEYAAQVETKLKIYADEHEMLILAGRYSVYLKQEKLKELLIVE